MLALPVFFAFPDIGIAPPAAKGYVPLVNGPLELLPATGNTFKILRSVTFWMIAVAFALITFSLLRDFHLASKNIYHLLVRAPFLGCSESYLAGFLY